MAMLTFLLTAAVLGVAICAGYRLNMYLYANGALGKRAHRMQLAETEAYPMSRYQDVPQDYGLHYMRTGFLVVIILIPVIVVGLIALLVSVL